MKSKSDFYNRLSMLNNVSLCQIPDINYSGTKDTTSNTPFTYERIYNDKADTPPQLFGQFVNFRLFIKSVIHEVKKTSKF